MLKKKEKETEKKNKEEANLPKEKPVKEEKSESKDKIHGEDIPVDSKEEAKPIQKVDTKNKEDEIKKEQMVEKDSKVETEQKSEKSFHIETAIVLDGNSFEDIRKDSMEVIGDSLKIKKLEDQIEDMLTTRTQVKDTQKKIQVLESILSSLKKEAIADEQRETGEKKYVKSNPDAGSPSENSIKGEDKKKEKETGENKDEVKPNIGEKEGKNVQSNNEDKLDKKGDPEVDVEKEDTETKETDEKEENKKEDEQDMDSIVEEAKDNEELKLKK